MKFEWNENDPQAIVKLASNITTWILNQKERVKTMQDAKLADAIMMPGTLVRMSEALKKQMCGDCTLEKHVRPEGKGLTDADYDDPNYTCIFCSVDHVEEFGECIGIVEDPVWPDHPELETFVRWLPSMLRYTYMPEDLEIIK